MFRGRQRRVAPRALPVGKVTPVHVAVVYLCRMKTRPLKITRIEITPLFIPLREPYHWTGRVHEGITVALVAAHTDDGTVGYGESTGNHSLAGVVDILRRADTLLRGTSPFDIARSLQIVWRSCDLAFVPRFGNLALAGLEMALWDVVGKATGLSVAALMGGCCRDAVDYFGFIQGDTAVELAESAGRILGQGTSVFYLKVGRGEVADLENVAAVRGVIGGRRLRLDANEAWSPATAIRMINLLAAYEPEFIEQPTLAGNPSALEQVKRSVSVPIAADQGAFTPADVYELCRRQAADLIVIGPHETGGLLAFKKAAAVAEAAGLEVCLHGQFVTGISDCAQHHVGLTTPNLTDGNQIMHQLLTEDLIATPDLTPHAGRLGALAEPGLGFTLDLDAVRRAAERYRRLNATAGAAAGETR